MYCRELKSQNGQPNKTSDLLEVRNISEYLKNSLHSRHNLQMVTITSLILVRNLVKNKEKDSCKKLTLGGDATIFDDFV